MTQIPFNDLATQRSRISSQLDAAIKRVLDHSHFILGPEVAELEGQLASYAGASHCVTCANGTDALVLTMMAVGIGPGDAVFVPAFTFVATAEAARLVGATPIFCDVEPETFNIATDSLARAILDARDIGLTPKAVIPVDLFGQPANYRQLLPLAEQHGLTVIADAAQSFGATLDNHRVGTFGLATTTSFFPAKPLGCYGDGGAILTQSKELADLLRSLRFHGKGTDKYDNVRVGLNSRLDTLQAAILLEKLKIFDAEIAARQRVAERYAAGLSGWRTPTVLHGATSVWAQYTLIVEDRDALAANLAKAGIPTAVYYPTPLSLQTGYRMFPTVSSGTPVSEWLAERVISLPMHAYLDEATQDRIIQTLGAARATTQK